MTDCDLCGLATPDPPVTGDDGGAFCCPGCRTVSEQLGPRVDQGRDGPATAETVRAAISEDGTPESLDEESGTDDTGSTEAPSVAYLRVHGMHCATCEAFLETRAAAIDGVVDVDASYPTDLLRVRYEPDRVAADTLPDRVSGYGYRARPVADAETEPSGPPWRLVVGGFLAMMVMMWYLLFLYPAYAGLVPTDGPAWGQTGVVSLVNLWIATTAVLAITGGPVLRGAFVSLRSGVPNMDLLIAVALIGAYTYSTAAALLGHVEVYFDVVVVIVIVVSLGRHYEDRIKRRAKGRLERLAQSRVTEATRRTPTGMESVAVDALDQDDEILVRPGERVPVDGTVLEGNAAVDESVVTGESLPVDRGPGDRVTGGAVVTDAPLVVRVDDPAERTIDRILARLWDLQSTRRGAGRLADRLAALFVPLVVVLAVGGALAHLALGSSLGGALLTGLTVLVVACPCALGLATPLAVAAGTRAALDRGTVVRTPAVFEVAPTVDVLAIDKTGTLTTGSMRVVDEPASDVAMTLAGAVEASSAHPIAEAIATRADTADREVTDFVRHPGRGSEAVVDGIRVLVGSPSLFEAEGWPVADTVASRVAQARDRGVVPVVVGWDGTARDVIGVGDRPRPGWADALAAVGTDRTVAILTGDDERATTVFRDHPAVDQVLAGLPPEGKAEAVARLRTNGPVAMVGDGTNDAPAMAAADLGVAIGTGAALTADAADVVLTRDGLAGLAPALSLAGAARRRIRENLAWAFVYNGVAIPAALLGVLDPLVAAVAMAASSVLVVANSARPIGPATDAGETVTDLDGERAAVAPPDPMSS